jgi:hypothetical protein
MVNGQNGKHGSRIERLPRVLQPVASLLRPAVASWRERAQANTLPNVERRKNVALAVHYVYDAGVEGDIAEFGTMTGLTAVEMARTIAAYKQPRWVERTLHLFDSFEGLPESQATADVESPHVKTGAWSAGTCRGLTADELLARCAKHLPQDRIAVHAGWFKDTMAQLPRETKLGLLHIDSDLYQSAWDVLHHAFSERLIAEGAIILFDDYDCNRASPLYGERRAWEEIVKTFRVEYSDGGAYGSVARKFLVHSYSQ